MNYLLVKLYGSNVAYWAAIDKMSDGQHMLTLTPCALLAEAFDNDALGIYQGLIVVAHKPELVKPVECGNYLIPENMRKLLNIN